MEREHGTSRDRPRTPSARTMPFLRPRLLDLLSDLPPLTVIRGPRGAGKSCLIAGWADSPQAPPGPLLILPSPGRDTAADEYWADVTHRLDGALASSSAPVTVVLDDVDRLPDTATESRVLSLLERDPRVRVVVTTRDTSVFGDAGLLDVDHLTVSTQDLLFTADESRTALARRGIELPRPLLETVQDLTGGLPPLVQAAVAVARPFGTDYEHSRELARHALERAIDRYVERGILGDPVLAEQRDFMLTIASARVVTVPVTDALTSADDAAARLRALESAGVLVRGPWPKDDEWRFLPPIRASLMRAAQRAAPAGPLPASTFLATWFRDRGDPVTALAYAAEARNWPLTIEILEAGWVEMVSRQFRLVRETLMAIPADAADGSLAIRAGRELFLRFGSGAAHLPEPTPIELETMQSEDPDEAADALAVGSVQSLILRVSGHFTQAAEMSARMSVLGDRVMTMPPTPVVSFVPTMRLQWGISHLLHGDLRLASAEFRRAYNSCRSAGPDYVARNAAGNLALVYALTGELGHAETWLEKERRYDDDAGWAGKTIRVGGLVAAASVAIDRMELDVAAKVLAELEHLPDSEELWPFAVYTHCRLALFTRQTAVGLDRVHRATTVYERWFTPGSVAAPLLAAAEADLHLALGHGNETWTTLSKAPGRGPWTTLAHARMELSSGHPTDALADCTRSTVFDCPYPNIRMESALIQAAAQLDLGDDVQAQAMLRRAVALFEQTGLVSPFAALPTGRIARLVELDVPLPVAWLAVAPAETDAVFPDRVQLVGLSDREAAVLHALESTPSIAEIAARLFVSQNTVKTQLRGLYRKLDVHSRADALLAAAQLGLIDRGADGTDL